VKFDMHVLFMFDAYCIPIIFTKEVLWERAISRMITCFCTSLIEALFITLIHRYLQSV
jgi:hypothetical protein